MKAVKITKGDKSITIARPRRGAAACPRFGGLTATSQLGK